MLAALPAPPRGVLRLRTHPYPRILLELHEVALAANQRSGTAMADDDDAFAMHLGVMGSKLSFSERLKQARQLDALLEAFSDDLDDSGAPAPLARAPPAPYAPLHPQLGRKLNPR